MNFASSRRGFLKLAGVGAAVALAGCGSGSVVSNLKPARFITVGDGFADVGQNGYRFTINDGSLNWVQQLAAQYSQTVEAASAGGWGYAQGYARVDSADTTSGTNAPSVSAQLDTLLARTTFVDESDVMMLNGGIADIVAAVNDTGISDATTETVKTAGRALAAQVRRVVAAGATHVVVTGVYNLGNTPWAVGLGLTKGIEALSVAFNDALLIDIADMSGNTVVYFDAALFFNLIYNKPENYPLDNARDPVCTTPDATTCTASTLVSGADATRWMFADDLYFTPTVQRMFASDNYSESAYYRFKNTW